VRAALKLLQTIIPAYRPSTLLAPAMREAVAAADVFLSDFSAACGYLGRIKRRS